LCLKRSCAHVVRGVAPLKIRGKGVPPKVLGKMPDRGGGAARAGRRRGLAVVAARCRAARRAAKRMRRDARQCGTRCGARFLERCGAGSKRAARHGDGGAAWQRNAAVQARPNKQASACTTAVLCLGALGLADLARVQGYSPTASRSAGARVRSEPATRRPARLRWRSGGAGKHLQEETRHEGRTGIHDSIAAVAHGDCTRDD
jgi:hypothetical protein